MSPVSEELIQNILNGKPFIMKQEASIAFIDLIGFTNFQTEDIGGAITMVEGVINILATKLNDSNQHPIEQYPTSELAELALSVGTTSFLLAYPISDSIIIISDDTDLFVVQLAHFISECFQYAAHVYDVKGEIDPTSVTMTKIGLDSNGNLKYGEEKEHWYPIMFKGGISYGEFILYPSKLQIGSHLKEHINFIGEGYIKAYKHSELRGPGFRGPRLFLDSSFIQRLGEKTRRYVVDVKVNGKQDRIQELVWPALMYHEGNNPEVEANEIPGRIMPILKLLKYYKNPLRNLKV